MGKDSLKFLRWLDQHSAIIFISGVAASVIVNAIAFERDKKAAKRLRDTYARPDLPDNPPVVSFLVPAWNEAHNVDACIRSILSLRYPNKELILCAGGGDGTLALCQQYVGDGVIVLEQSPGEGKQGALRRCFAHSSGEILFQTDADCILDDACVEATLAPLLFENEDAVTGFWQPFEFYIRRPFIEFQWANHLRYQAEKPDYAETLDGRNSAIRRDALIRAGAFQNDAVIGTDYVLSQRLKAAGYCIHSVTASRVQTEYPVEFPDYLKQGSRWYRNRLLQGLKFRQWQDVFTSLWGAGASLFIFAGWLALLLRWRAVGAAWMAGLVHLTFGQARLVAFFKLSAFGQGAFLSDLPRFTVFTMLSNLAMVKGLLDCFNFEKQKKW